MAYTTPKTWASGLVSVSDLNTYVSGCETELQNAVPLGSSSFTPVCTGSTTNPTGYTALGQYFQIGGLVTYVGSITFASTVGSGTYLVSTPVAIGSSWAGALGNVVAGYGVAFIQTSGGAARVQLQVGQQSGTLRFYVQSTSTTVGAVSNTNPVTVASGTILSWQITYGVT